MARLAGITTRAKEQCLFERTTLGRGAKKPRLPVSRPERAFEKKAKEVAARDLPKVLRIEEVWQPRNILPRSSDGATAMRSGVVGY